MNRKKRLTGLKAYQVKRLIDDAREDGKQAGRWQMADMFLNMSLWQRLRAAFRGEW